MRRLTIENKTVHELRETIPGRRSLQADGRYKSYVTAREGDSRQFIAWDGEGWSDETAEHSYMLLAVSTGEHISAPRLTTWECLDFMLSVGNRYKKCIHIIYGGGYDITHILRDVPLEDRQILRNVGSVSFSTPVFWSRRNRYTIEYIPHKWFVIAGYDNESRKFVRFKVYDIMTFFQSSAIAAWKSRGIELPDEIISGKASRADFTWSDIDEVRYYCQLELDKYVELAYRLRSEFKEVNLSITQWHGPGAVASAVFKKYGIKDHMKRPPLEIEKILQHTYFGGRFEQFKAGHYSGRVYVYDINSAYPDKIRNLPSLRGSRWEWSDTFDGSLGVWLCEYESNDETGFSPNPLPWRAKNGSVGFPVANAGVWLWTPEAQLATRVSGGWKLIIADRTKPFAFVADMYKQRKIWKKEGRGGEKALKLAMNSIYGKLAQRIGGREENDFRPPWHQLEWAGLITSQTRRQIWDAVSQAPDKIIAVETDSVASTVPLNLPVSEELGDWELTVYDDGMTYLQSGIYFTQDKVHGGKVRTRGIDVKALDYAEVMKYLASNGEDDELIVPAREFIGLTNPRTYLYGQWTDTVKSVRVGGGKRLHVPGLCPECAAGRSMADSMHPMISNQRMGNRMSAAHKLPWLDGMDIPDDPEFSEHHNEAIADWEKERISA